MKTKQIILFILILVWMIVVFCFSGQDGETSGKTSETTVQIIVDTLPSTKKLKQSEKEIIIQNLDPIIRKMAHYSLYTLGGVIIYSFINTFNISKNKKIIYSILIGSGYAITDEIHQAFLPGRSNEIMDVLIDTLGILTGIAITIFITKLLKKVKKRKI